MIVVVLGAGGYLGSNMVRLLRERFEVISVSRSAERTSHSFPFDQWTAVFDERRDASLCVLNTIAIADHDACERDAAACDDVNHLLAERVGRACAQRSVPLIHISTDGLFGQGTVATAPAYYGLTSVTVASNTYAHSKRAAEIALERLGWGHVLRLSFVGPDNGTGRGLARFIADRARAGALRIDGFVDNWFTPVHVSDVAEVVARKCEAIYGGFSLQHVASYPAVTKYDFLSAVVAKSGVAMSVVPVKRPLVSARTPVDQSLRAERPVELRSVVERSARDVRGMLEDYRPVETIAQSDSPNAPSR